MRLCVVGGGYVGLVTAACLAELGHDCVVADIDAAKVERINRGEPPIHERGLPALLRRVVAKRLRATTDVAAAVRASEATFLAVGTPFDGARIDLSFLLDAARTVGNALRSERAPHVVIVKSTVVPGTTDGDVARALEAASGRRVGSGLGIGVNPEFLTEGVAIDDFMQPDRIVIGGDPAALEVLHRIYASFSSTPLIVTNNATAELIKYASNALLATLISFSNEIADVGSAVGGIDVVDVMRGVHASRYLTVRSPDGRATTAPIASFLWAGCGFGGSCLPKDTKALRAHAAALGREMHLLDAVIGINQGRPLRMLDLLDRHYHSLRGLRVSVLGLAFKEDTDDVRESPSIPIVRALVERGACVTAYDPIANENARALLPGSVGYAQSLAAAVAGAEAILVCTRWNEFHGLAALVKAESPPPLVIDGRRMLEPAQFPRYDGIGL